MNYDAETQCWQCPALWMSDATFKRYVDAWLEARGISTPSLDQRRLAAEHCRILSYWRRYGDPDVHWSLL